jgi:hypothetical protein
MYERSSFHLSAHSSVGSNNASTEEHLQDHRSVHFALENA